MNVLQFFNDLFEHFDDLKCEDVNHHPIGCYCSLNREQEEYYDLQGPYETLKKYFPECKFKAIIEDITILFLQWQDHCGYNFASEVNLGIRYDVPDWISTQNCNEHEFFCLISAIMYKVMR